MKVVRGGVIVALALAVVATAVSASGPVGVYGIVERVVFEPNETSPERVQVWGVFAYVDGCGANRPPVTGPPVECGVGAARAAKGASGISPAERGYLYFKLPAVVPGLRTEADVVAAKREWADIASVAGTGQAIGFGRWGYIGSFASIRPDRRDGLHAIAEARTGDFTDLRVRPASEEPANPATYQTNAGIVKLSEQGSHAAIVALLRGQLR